MLAGPQIVGTAILRAVICGLTDPCNAPPAPAFAPLVVGLLVVAIGAAFGFNAGYAINPARDFGPRLFTAMDSLGRRGLPRGKRMVVGAACRPAPRRSGWRLAL
jgi:glycerol uptake facilitator protein